METTQSVLPFARRPTQSIRSAPRVIDAARSSIVLQFSGVPNDEVALKRVAPWTAAESTALDAWLGCLFVARLSKHLNASIGPSTAAKIGWAAQYGGWAKGKISTPHGNVIITLIKPSCSAASAYIEGHRNALVCANVAQANWLHTESRQGRRTAFPVVVFDAERIINVTRSGERYRVTIEFTDEESREVDPNRLNQASSAKSAAESAVKTLPGSRSDYLHHFAGVAGTMMNAIERLAYGSKGGFSLDEGSRTEILTQLDGLRKQIQEATVKFDARRRQALIACIAQKHAPNRNDVHTI